MVQKEEKLMGSWGHGILDNDSYLNLLSEFDNWDESYWDTYQKFINGDEWKTVASETDEVSFYFVAWAMQNGIHIVPEFEESFDRQLNKELLEVEEYVQPKLRKYHLIKFQEHYKNYNGTPVDFDNAVTFLLTGKPITIVITEQEIRDLLDED